MPPPRTLPAGAIARLGSDHFRSGAVIDSLAFSADGRILFSSSHWAEHVCVWSVPDGRHVLALDAGGSVRSMAVSADGRWLAAGADRGEMGHLVLWDAVARKRRRVLRPYRANSTHAVAFSADGSTLVTSSFIEVPEETITVWDVAGGKKRAAFEDPMNGSLSLALSPNGQTLAVVPCSDIELRAVSTGKLRCTLTSKHGEASRVTFSPDGRLLASADEKGIVHLWNLSGGWLRRKPRLLRKIKRDKGHVSGLAFPPDSAILAVASNAGMEDRAGIRLWRVDNGRKTLTLDDMKFACCVCFSPDGTLLASSAGARIHLWDSRTGEPRFVPTGQLESIVAGSFSPDGRFVVDPSTDARPRLFQDPQWDYVEVLAFSLDRQHLYASGKRGRIRIWDITGGQIVRTLEAHRGGTAVLDFSPDGRRMLTAGGDCTALVWDATRLV